MSIPSLSTYPPTEHGPVRPASTAPGATAPGLMPRHTAYSLRIFVQAPSTPYHEALRPHRPLGSIARGHGPWPRRPTGDAEGTGRKTERTRGRGALWPPRAPKPADQDFLRLDYIHGSRQIATKQTSFFKARFNLVDSRLLHL